MRIESLRREQWPEAAHVLARAFVTNPLHIAAFGPGEVAKSEAFFRLALNVMRGPMLVATGDSGVLGAIHWVDSPGCRYSRLEKLRMMPAMIRGLGLPSALRLASWLSHWSRQDPAEPHSHLGPIGVSPDAQGRGVGQRLMERYCAQLDRVGGVGYLETDRPENVPFYRRFGFETTEQDFVLGVPSYSMIRRRGTACAASAVS